MMVSWSGLLLVMMLGFGAHPVVGATNLSVGTTLLMNVSVQRTVTMEANPPRVKPAAPAGN